MIDASDNAQKHEYLRYFGDMRFKQLTLLMGFMSVAVGGIVAVGRKSFIPGVDLQWVIAAIGLLFTSMLWIMEVRSTVAWSEVKSATAVTWPFYKYFFPLFINATFVVLGFYMAIYVFWSYCIFVIASKIFLCIVPICMFAILVVISVVNYSHCIKITRQRKGNCEPVVPADSQGGSAV
jgi:hypothetical protein